MPYMTVDELIEQLEQIRDVHGAGSAPVSIAYQPNYPMQALSFQVAFVDLDDETETEGVAGVYLGASDNATQYLNGRAAEELGWR